MGAERIAIICKSPKCCLRRLESDKIVSQSYKGAMNKKVVMQNKKKNG